MATVINGAVVTQDGYSFGVKFPDNEVEECINYNVAKAIADQNEHVQLVMAVHYVTDWMDAQ